MAKRTTKKSNKKTKKSGLRKSFNFLPNSPLNRLMVVLTLILGALAAGGSAYFLLAHTPPLAEGKNGCYYDFFENKTDSTRASYRLSKLTRNGYLEANACSQAKRMQAQQRLYHDLVPGSSTDWCKNACGQVVGVNTNGNYLWSWPGTTKGWMQSPPHRNIILNKTWKNQGCAYYRGYYSKAKASAVWAVCNYQHFI